MNHDDLDTLAASLDRLHLAVLHLVSDVEPRLDSMRSDASTLTQITDRMRVVLNRLDAEEPSLRQLARHATRIVDDLTDVERRGEGDRDNDRGDQR